MNSPRSLIQQCVDLGGYVTQPATTVGHGKVVVTEEILQALTWNRRSPDSEQGWLPIESAPKDGTQILLWMPELPGWLPGPWRGSWSFLVEEWCISTPYQNSDGKNVMASGLPSPALWRPLPPPAIAKDAQ